MTTIISNLPPQRDVVVMRVGRSVEGWGKGHYNLLRLDLNHFKAKKCNTSLSITEHCKRLL